MRDVLVVVRRLALGAVVLSAVAIPVGRSRDHMMPPVYVVRMYIDPVPNDGSVDGMNRAMILVALAGAPDPDSVGTPTGFGRTKRPVRTSPCKDRQETVRCALHCTES